MIDLNTNNLILLFNILLYTITFVIYYKRKKYFNLGSFLLIIYAFVSLISFSLFNDPESLYYFKYVSLFPFIYLFILILIAAYPILKLDEAKIQRIITPEKSVLTLFALVVILVMILLSFDVLGNLDKILINMVADATNANDLYTDSRDQLDSEGINILGVLSSAFRDFPQFLLFYFLTLKEKNNKLIIIGLLFSVLISLLSGLVNGLRGNVIFVLQSCVFLYLIFFRFYSNKIRKIIKVSFLILFLLIAIPFVVISIGRFSTGYSSYGDSGYASKSYSGQSFLYFNNYGLDDNGIRYGDRTANLFKRTIFDDVPKNYEARRAKYSRMTINDGVFSTFVGDFTLDFGPIAAFFIFIMMSVFISMKTRIKETAYLHQILLLYFVWNVVVYGVFLFPYADISGNLRIVLCIILFVVFRFTTNSKQYITQNIDI